MIRRALLAAGWLCLAVSAVDARDIFVDNQAGDDAASGETPTPVEANRGPLRTIGRALHLAAPADRIVLANTGEAYRESLTFSGPKHSGYTGAPVTLDGGDAVLDGSKRIAAADWEAVGGDVFRYLPNPITYVSLFLNGRPLTEIRPAKPAEQKAPAELQPLEWTRFDRHIYFRIEAGKNLDDYALSIPGADVGITLYKVKHITIANLVVQNFRLDGINVADAQDCLIVNVVGRGNGRSGVAVTGPSRAVVEGCRLGKNGAAQLWLSGWSRTELIDSTLYESPFGPTIYRGPNVKLTVQEGDAQPAEAGAEPQPRVDPQPGAPGEAETEAVPSPDAQEL